MDKYQASLIKRGTFSFSSELGGERIEIADGLVLYQNDNYNAKGYKILITNDGIDAVTYLGKRYTAKNGFIEVDFAFDNAGKEITVSFKNGIADDYTFPLFTILADKNAYDSKIAADNQKRLCESASLVVGTGVSLLNIYWKKAEATIDRCVVRVHFHSDQGVEYLVLEKETNGECLIVKDLAFGKYSVTLEEFTGKTLIVSSTVSINLTDGIQQVRKDLQDLMSLMENGFLSVGPTVN